jgi:hypothetical protein
MSSQLRTRAILTAVALCLTAFGAWSALRSDTAPGPARRAAEAGSKDDDSAVVAKPSSSDAIDHRFAASVRPFVERYCVTCHNPTKHRGQLDLSRAATVAAIAANLRPWERVLERLQAHEMPPESAKRRPTPDERAAVITWIRDLREREARQHAGDPGTVLARRLSNAEYDYTIRDLTGVDIRPTREFPVDPANEAGFDNSGESLTMSPALLKKYLAAARLVADHAVLTPDGLAFAPHPVVTETDRDKYCVHRILAFYARHRVDYADYFLAAWKYRHRARLGRPGADLNQFAAEAGLSAKYLSLVRSALNDADADAGPLAVVRKLWHELPQPVAGGDGRAAPSASRRGQETRAERVEDAARRGCAHMRDVVVRLRAQFQPKVRRLSVRGISDGSQSFVLWHNRELAGRHRSYSGSVLPDLRSLAGQFRGADAGLAKLLTPATHDAATERLLRAPLERFCAAFPDTFVVIDRGPYYDPNERGQERPLTAGFHLMQGYFRDDGPLYDLVLDERQRRELDGLWHELNFITLAPMRQYKDFIFFERAEPPRFMIDAQFDFARSEDKDATSEAKMSRLARVYLAKARKNGAGADEVQAIEAYFTGMSAEIRRVERARLAAEPKQLAALVQFAERAYRRPLSAAERDDLLAFYHTLRRQDELGHEDAVRDTLVSVLLSPHFCYRLDLPHRGDTRKAVHPLSDYALASRLSYFLWSSMPDAELLGHTAAGDLHRPDVLKVQARRMLRDPRVRGLATEFGGNWLDFRRFEEHNAVDRGRFPTFTNDLRQAMFEEPIRYLVDMAQHNRSVLDLLYGKDTFVNSVLARHYGMADAAGLGDLRSGVSAGSGDSRRAQPWFHVEDARRYGRGGLLTMAVFLTKNAPGLRTSPVKRGYWVVRRVLGEVIPPPPPTVPELPKDEADLGKLTLPQVLARHRADKSCAACHRRFDSVGLVFEGFGPVGERRTKDLAGHPVATGATFPDGKERDGVEGLRAYLSEKRQADFVDNLCRKLFAYALGRGLIVSDQQALQAMTARLAGDRYAFGSLVEEIVTSPQFLNKSAVSVPPWRPGSPGPPTPRRP